jgi:hypothetical protein
MKALVTVALLTAATAAGAKEPQLPGWMAGCWEQREGDRWTEECWTGPRGGTMLGVSRTGRGDKLLEWEMLRIEQGEAGQFAYLAAPGGEGWTRFDGVQEHGPGVAFVNRTNDYPQRIRYWRDGAGLHAEIAMADGTKARRWRFRRR